ncbi:c-type cytochrome [bacterium]|mgnify:CR=1 FL=1|jgi:cytochrome c oxidase cbb3-type subunit III|nr:c-type cytochrome [bacterium]
MSTNDQPQDDKLLDHNYDGIQELDNPLPKWWVNLFYITGIFSVFYFGYYVFGTGPSLEEEFQASMKQDQETQQTATPSAITFTHSDDSITNGKKLFVSKCAACHKASGGGLVGPNLTDNYWITGKGTDQDIFNVISEGVPAKGMIAWKDLVKANEIADLVVYIQSIKGSNPADGLPPNGNLVE